MSGSTQPGTSLFRRGRWVEWMQRRSKSGYNGTQTKEAEGAKEAGEQLRLLGGEKGRSSGGGEREG